MGRRGLLGAGVAALLGAAPLAGCMDETASPISTPRATPSPSLDDVAVARARADAADLASAAQQLAASRPDLAPLLDAVAADHRAHLAALGEPTPSRSPSLPLSTPSPPTPSTGPSPSPPTPSGAVELRTLVARERAGAQAALDAAPPVSGGVAGLLVRIAASRAVHADLLAARTGLPVPLELRTSPAARQRAAAGAITPGQVTPAPPLPVPVPSTPMTAPTPTASPSPAPLTGATGDALVALTAGEHAAVYAYGAIVARVAARDRDRARQAWSWHMSRRDLLEERLLAAGLQPPAAAPAYELGLLRSPAAAATLAATVEDRLAALTVRAIAASTGADRWTSAEALVAGARRAAGWRGHGEALPG
jgi:hypothetical protein